MRFISQDDAVLSNDQGEPLGSNLYAYCLNNPVNSSDPTGSFGTPIQWAMAIIGGIAGWYFGDYVAKKLGYKSGWKYWAIRAGVVVGGAVIGWFAGTAIVKVATKFLLANPTVMAKLPGPVLWLLGLSNGGQLANELFQRYANHIFSSEHIKNGILKLGSSKRHIFDKIYSIIQSSMSKSVNGSNQIHTIINGHKVTIRFYLKDGVIKSMDAFTGWASRIIGNLIKK